MKIPLTISQEKVTIIATVRYKRIFGFADFFIDTGSPTSFIGHNDALKLKIPVTSLPFDHPAKIGGGSMALNKIENVTFNFKKDDGTTATICQPKFLVAHNLRKGDETAHGFPSILGLDFLSEHKFTLQVSPHKGEAYLKNEDD